MELDKPETDKLTSPSRQFMVQQAVLCALAAEMPESVRMRGAAGTARWFLAHTSIADPMWDGQPRRHFLGRQICNQFRAIAAEYGVQVAA